MLDHDSKSCKPFCTQNVSNLRLYISKCKLLWAGLLLYVYTYICIASGTLILIDTMVYVVNDSVNISNLISCVMLTCCQGLSILMLCSSFIMETISLDFSYITRNIKSGLITQGFPGGASGKEPACQCRSHSRFRFNSELGRSPKEGNGNPFQYSCVENPMDRGSGRLQSIGLQRVRHE